MADKQQETAVVIGVAISSGSYSREEEHEKLEKMWRMKATVLIGALGAVTIKLGESLQQEQHLRTLFIHRFYIYIYICVISCVEYDGIICIHYLSNMASSLLCSFRQ